MNSSRCINVLLVAGACFLALLLYGANLYFGDLNHDEGWYLYAARQVSRGILPYRDFCFTQAPLLPLIYGILKPLWEGAGIAGGRLVTVFFGFFSALLAAWLAWRLSPSRIRFHAALTCFILISGNIYQSYFTAIVKTYSLTALFLCAGFMALSFVHTGRAAWGCSLGGLFLACAAGARISAGVALPVTACYLIWQRKRTGYTWSWLIFSVAFAVTLTAIFLPWLILARDEFFFGMSFHTARNAGGLLAGLLYKAGFVSRCLRVYYLTAVLAGVAGMWWWIVRRDVGGDPAACPSEGSFGKDPSEKSPPYFIVLLVGVGLLISLLHFMAPFPYDDYQVPVFPLFAVIIAVLFWRVVERSIGDCRDGAISETLNKSFGNIQECLQILIFGAAILGALSSQINQDWFVVGQDRFWWPKKEKPDIQLLRETAAWIRELHQSKGSDPSGGQKGTLLTQDTYLAVEAGLDVPSGLEMGPFCYFPKLSTEKARKYKVLNRELMANLLQTTDAQIAAFSGYGLAIVAPEMTEMPADEQEFFWKIVRERYELVGKVPHFGQAHTTLTIWKRKQYPN